ncbi:MAG: hypothetical protein COB15_08650 [Flavobacteriales bacterium]|nr:MAG: hypothetical protein COB15_08650 [Flavobacteriales bacterium]
MPGRNFSSSSYRFGFNGMEKDDEVKGSTGTSYTTYFRQYDPRLGRFHSMDPVNYPWQSDYAAFNNNPIFFADPSGAEGEKGKGSGKAKRKKKRANRKARKGRKGKNKKDSGGKAGEDECEGCYDDTRGQDNKPRETEPEPDIEDSPKKAKFKIKAISFSLGDKFSTKAKEGTQNPTSIWGNNTFYNTAIKAPYVDQLSEPNLFGGIEAKFENGGTVGFHFNKEKFTSNSDGFGFRGPTNLGLNFGINYQFGENSRFSINSSVSLGIVFGEPGFGDNKTIPVSGGSGFRYLGGFVSVITQVNFRVINKWYIFLAGTVSYRQMKSFDTGVGKQITPDIRSGSLNFGIGIDIDKNPFKNMFK